MMIDWLTARQILRLPLFYKEFFATHAFPDQFQRLEEVVEWASQRKGGVMGFNRECIKAYIVWKIFDHFRCTSFVETGTGWGYTAGFVRRAFNTSVFTCEVDGRNYLVASLNLLLATRTRVSRSDSPDFVKWACQQDAIGSKSMFYLDAHGHEYLPLRDELLTIAERCTAGVVVMDDFSVPSAPGFRSDYSKIGPSSIRDALSGHRSDVCAYVPAYDPARELKGWATGMAVVVMKEELPTHMFPFTLLQPLALSRSAQAT